MDGTIAHRATYIYKRNLVLFIGSSPWDSIITKSPLSSVFIQSSALISQLCNFSFALDLKVSKSRKQILKFSFAPKNERKYFCISALAYKKRSNQKSSVRESK